MCVLNREVERCSVTLEAFAHQHRLDQEKIENLSSKVCQLERNISVRDLQLSETEQQVRELQYCTYDGIFVWKIFDFSRRRQDAVAGRTPAMFSPGEIDSSHVSPVLEHYWEVTGTGVSSDQERKLSKSVLVRKKLFEAVISGSEKQHDEHFPLFFN